MAEVDDRGEEEKTGNSFVTYPEIPPIITPEIRQEALQVQKDQLDKKLDIVELWREQGIVING
jgi:hypothetical protein